MSQNEIIVYLSFYTWCIIIFLTILALGAVDPNSQNLLPLIAAVGLVGDIMALSIWYIAKSCLRDPKIHYCLLTIMLYCVLTGVCSWLLFILRDIYVIVSISITFGTILISIGLITWSLSKLRFTQTAEVPNGNV
jgi:hypothetical protein